MADLITIQQFEARTGRSLNATKLAQAEALIEDASALAIDLVADSTVTDSWDSDTVPAAVVPVVVAMVRRGLDNPHGLTQESIGDYSYSGRSGVGVFATRQEAKVLRKAAGTSAAGSINLEGYLPGSGPVWTGGAL